MMDDLEEFKKTMRRELRTAIAVAIVVIIVLISLQAAHASCEIRAGAGVNENFTSDSVQWETGGGKIGGMLSLTCQVQIDHMIVGGGWIHISNWDAGPPLNDNLEATVDHVGFYIGFRFW